MQCPIDQTELVETERQGVDIDYCPTCRGVWLDRGELDKIIQRANEASGTTDAGAGAGAAGGAAGSAARGSFTTPRVGNMQGRVEPLESERRPDDDDSGGYDWDEKKQKVKVSPLARWTDEDVEKYIAENGILVNPLQYDGYPSIGCWPCTRRRAC